LSVRKANKKGGSDNQFANLPHFTFSEESKRAMGDLFAHFPPGDGNLKDLVGEKSGSMANARHRHSDIFSRPVMTKDEITRKLEAVTSKRETVSDLKEVIFPLSIQLQRPCVYEFFWIDAVLFFPFSVVCLF
jgi:ATP-dependent RNA helicase DHX36